MSWASVFLLCAALGAVETPVVVSGPISAPVSVPIAVPNDVLLDYRAWLADRDPLTITTYAGPHSRRDVVEVALFQQAVRRGGYDLPLDLVEMPSYARLLEELHHARVAASANTLWLSDLDGKSLTASAALIPAGEFIAGIYVRENNPVLAAADQGAQVRDLRFVCSPTWKADWMTLHGLGLTVEAAPTWEAMVRMLAQGRADAVLAPFQPSDDFAFTAFDTRLLPLRGVRVALAGSRHFALATHHPAAAEMGAALARGLAAMRADSTIERAYTECGFFDQRVTTWPVMTPEPEK